MNRFATLVCAVLLFSLAACGGGSGGGFVVVEEFSNCPLCKAVNDDDSEQVEFLLQSGENPNAADEDNFTVLMIASRQGHLDIVKILLDAGVNLRAVDNTNGFTALIWAAEGGHPEVVQILLSAGAKLNAASSTGKTALHMAAWQGRLAATKALLAAGANLNAADKEDGGTALHIAAWQGHPDVVKMLLAAGANPDTTDKHAQTALIIAGRYNNLEVLKVLLAAGANPDAADIDGWTALNIAANNGQPQVAKMLLECGANPDIRNKYGVNAWHWANRQPVMHAIFYKHLAEVKAGKDIKPCLQKEVAAAPPLPKGENIAEKVFENAWRSVVVVKSGGRQGSGVIVRPNAVATNCHVVEGGDIVVYKHDNRRATTDTLFNATIRKRDDDKDFCLLDVLGLQGKFAKVRRYDTLKIGEDVYAVGSPKGLDLSLSSGIISQLRQGTNTRYIQTDASVSPGSSGGGLFDSGGNLIGILTSKIADEDVEGIGFAIPADLADNL